ncbi:MAG: hypothetical protein WKF35_08465 [Ferruginibacter sp.]
MIRKKEFWITVSLINLCIVALLGFGLRSKILFPISFIDYRNLLSAHSHFAFSGWAGLALMTLMIHEILPTELSGKKTYAWLLTGVHISSLGMAIIFPFYGYNVFSLFFSTLYIAVTVVFAPIFVFDVVNTHKSRLVKLLSISAIICLILSYLGTMGLVYILSSKSGNSLLYRDSIYTFLHFQYNGFFTLAIFALFYNHLIKKGLVPGRGAFKFSMILCLSVLPSLFLALLWHNNMMFYIFASIGCLLILLSIVYFFGSLKNIKASSIFSISLARTLLVFAAFSFVAKMVLNAGTIIPSLGDAVYGDRPVIIGFLHLIFLGFMSFYILAVYIEQGIFTMRDRLLKFPIFVFTAGIFLNELILFLQGLVILLKFNSEIFKWLLWLAAIVLFAGACMMVVARIKVHAKKKDTADTVSS